MRFPNSLNCVKKLFLAELLGMIAAVLGAVSSVMLIGSSAAIVASGGNSGGAIATAGISVLMTVATVVLGIVAFAIRLTGLNCGAKEEIYFRKAFNCVFVGLAASIFSGIFSLISVLSSLLSIVSTVAGILVTLFVIQAIMNLADKTGDVTVKAKGFTLLKLIIGIAVANVVLNILSAIFRTIPAMSSVAGVLGIILSIVQIIQYILYLIYLVSARKMLESTDPVVVNEA